MTQLKRTQLVQHLWLQVLYLFVSALAVVISLGGCSSQHTSTASLGSRDNSSTLPQINDAGVTAGIEAATPTQDETTNAVTITLFAAGDVIVHAPVWQSGQHDDGTYQYDHLWVNIADQARSADLALISQETILGGTDLGLSGYPAFNGPFEIGDSEVAAGFDVMIKASNHALDKGAVGIANELAFWRAQHPEIGIVGIADSQESYEKIYLYEQEGLRIAILSYAYGTNGIPLPDNNPWATHYLDRYHEDEVIADVTQAQELADLVIVWPHWGTEYQSTPDEDQQYFAQLFCDLGVDIVIGSHPHTIGPVEVKQRDDGHQTLVFYSLGNYLSNQIQGVMTSVGAQVSITLTKDETGAHVGTWVFEPTVTQRAYGSDFAVWRLRDYTDTLAATNLTPLTRQECEEYCSQVLGDSYDQATSTLSGSLS